MKKIVLSFLLLVSTLTADMVWADYDEAFTKAKKENKIVMVMISSSSCGVCNYMKSQVYPEASIIEQFNKKFIGVELDLEMDDIPAMLPYPGTPTFYFLDSNKKILSNFSGGKNAKSFSKALDSIH